MDTLEKNSNGLKRLHFRKVKVFAYAYIILYHINIKMERKLYSGGNTSKYMINKVWLTGIPASHANTK